MSTETSNTPSGLVEIICDGDGFFHDRTIEEEPARAKLRAESRDQLRALYLVGEMYNWKITGEDQS